MSDRPRRLGSDDVLENVFEEFRLQAANRYAEDGLGTLAGSTVEYKSLLIDPSGLDGDDDGACYMFVLVFTPPDSDYFYLATSSGEGGLLVEDRFAILSMFRDRAGCIPVITP